jgi:hypothetical protein
MNPKTSTKQTRRSDASAQFMRMKNKGHESALCAAFHQILEAAPYLCGFTQPPTTKASELKKPKKYT